MVNRPPSPLSLSPFSLLLFPVYPTLSLLILFISPHSPSLSYIPPSSSSFCLISPGIPMNAWYVHAYPNPDLIGADLTKVAGRDVNVFKTIVSL